MNFVNHDSYSLRKSWHCLLKLIPFDCLRQIQFHSFSHQSKVFLAHELRIMEQRYTNNGLIGVDFRVVRTNLTGRHLIWHISLILDQFEHLNCPFLLNLLFRRLFFFRAKFLVHKIRVDVLELLVCFFFKIVDKRNIIEIIDSSVRLATLVVSCRESAKFLYFGSWFVWNTE